MKDDFKMPVCAICGESLHDRNVHVNWEKGTAAHDQCKVRAEQKNYIVTSVRGVHLTDAELISLSNMQFKKENEIGKEQ